MNFQLKDRVKTHEGTGTVTQIEPGYLLVKLDAGHFHRVQIDRVVKLEEKKK